MGLVLGTIIKQEGIARRNELEEKIASVKKAQNTLSASVKDLLNAGTDLDPESPAAKQLEQRKIRLNALEKELDMKLDEYQTALKLVEKTIQGGDNMVESAIGRK